MNFDLFWFDYLRIAGSIFAILTLPGWALLTVTDYWKNWATLQRWIVAIGLSIAFYPILFYWSRTLLPALQIGPHKNWAILIIAGVWISWKLRHNWKKQFQFDKLEWFALIIFAATLLTRYWIAYTHPFPAWADSLHHTLLTKLTAESGRLPYTLAPYAPTPLDMYHLGLYALTGTIQQIANVPAHTALLWMAQTLNGLCTLGVYLVLDRKAGRIGAISGAAAVGLWSHMPAWYVNWGRFTQVSGQAILLIAGIMTWDGIEKWQTGTETTAKKLWILLLAGGINAGVFLLHFRVAGYYLPLLLAVLGWMLSGPQTTINRRKTVWGILIVGGFAILMILPAILPAIQVYIARRIGADPIPEKSIYHGFPVAAIPELVAYPWLLMVASLSGFYLLFRRNTLGVLTILWGFILILFGNTYRLRIPMLTFTNMTGIFIMYYLHIGILVGAAVEMVVQKFRLVTWLAGLRYVGVGLFIVFGIWQGYQRITGVEEYRYFVIAADLEAMQWIVDNTPEDAVFAINTYLWLGAAPHGVDGGYWIPYFTGRRTTAGPMLSAFSENAYRAKMQDLSSMALSTRKDPNTIIILCEQQVKWVYFHLTDNQQENQYLEQLKNSGAVISSYQSNEVIISEICP